jgi:hypothetical protein
MTTDLTLVVAADGVARCIYDEALDLREIGTLKITRTNHVEPDSDGCWWVDMGRVDGPPTGPNFELIRGFGGRAGRVNEMPPCTPRMDQRLNRASVPIA